AALLQAHARFPAPDIAPRMLRHEALPLAVQLCQVGGHAVDVLVAEHLSPRRDASPVELGLFLFHGALLLFERGENRFSDRHFGRPPRRPPNQTARETVRAWRDHWTGQKTGVPTSRIPRHAPLTALGPSL